jgi:hypothetical protein
VPWPCRRIAGRFAEPTCTEPPDHPFCCHLPRCARAAVRRSSSTTTNHWSTGTTSCSTSATGVTRCRPGPIRPHFPLPSLRTPSASSTAGSTHTPAIVAAVAIGCDAATEVRLRAHLWPSVAQRRRHAIPGPQRRRHRPSRKGHSCTGRQRLASSGEPWAAGSRSAKPTIFFAAQGRSGEAPIAAVLSVAAAPRSGTRCSAALVPVQLMMQPMSSSTRETHELTPAQRRIKTGPGALPGPPPRLQVLRVAGGRRGLLTGGSGLRRPGALDDRLKGATPAASTRDRTRSPATSTRSRVVSPFEDSAADPQHSVRATTGLRGRSSHSPPTGRGRLR